MVWDNYGGDQVDWFVTGFYDARIGEAIYGFSDQYEEEDGGTITILAASQIGDLADILKAFPQMTYNEYMYERSIAQMQFMVNDNSHIKYLKGRDKVIWENYQKMLKAQERFDAFIGIKDEDND